jgi:hypothetical protein
MRLDYAAAAPEATKALAGVNAALLRAGLDKRLMDLLSYACHRSMAAPTASINTRATCDGPVSPTNASMASPDGERA